MNLYFGSTSPRFVYGHYLAVISALKTQHVEKVVLVCTVLPESPYFDLIKNKVQIVMFDQVNFPMLANKDLHSVAATVKDYIEWVTLLQNGGIFMDLDTFSISDVSSLLNNCDVVVTPYHIQSFDEFDIAVVIVKQNSIVIRETLSYAVQSLQNSSSKYTSTGPVAFTKAVLRHKNIVCFAPTDTFNPRIIRGTPIQPVSYIPAWNNLSLPANTRVLHLMASSKSKPFYSVDQYFARYSDTMYAKAIRRVLTESEWAV
jgi:hypothetical protein